MPQFDGATGWKNGSLDDVIEAAAGKPVLVHFWAVSCGVCKEKMPQLNALVSKYEPCGLQTVAVHMPRYEADTDLEKVSEAIVENEIHGPVAVDNMHKLRDAFQNEQGWVPVYYLFDRDGKLKTRAAGEFGITVVTTALEKMFPAEVVVEC